MTKATISELQQSAEFCLLWESPLQISCSKLNGMIVLAIPACRVLLHRRDVLLLPALADAPEALLQAHPQAAPRVHGARLVGRHLLPPHRARPRQPHAHGVRTVAKRNPCGKTWGHFIQELFAILQVPF